MKNKMPLQQRLLQYCFLMRLHKPIGLFLLGWPALIALFFAANGMPPLSIFILFVLGIIVMRSLGCVINDIADRNFDGFVKRTKNRPLASGVISVKEAIGLLIFLCACAFAIVLCFNRLTIVLSFVGLALACIYPFAKRFFYAPQAVLGLAFAWSIPMAFAALNAPITIMTGLLFLQALIWPIAYDTQYAMVDREDDLKIHIHSLAIFLGKNDICFIVILQIIVLLLNIFIGFLNAFPLRFYIAIIPVALCFVYQLHLIKKREPSDCFRAFLNNHYAGLFLFIAYCVALI